MKVGIYVHIPFCASRCIYCGFYSTTNAKLQTKYIDALTKEMKMRSNAPIGGTNICEADIDTIYIGGGTPSTLSLDNVERIVKAINDNYHCSESVREFTMEMNPDDVDAEYISAVRQMGVNRISLGIQSFDDNRLRFIRRRHTSAQAKEAVGTIRTAGIENISIDLMFGFPDEATSDWAYDLRSALALNPDHISAYSLMYEEGTPLYKMLEKGSVRQNDEDTCLKMYTMLMDTLKENGYEHYEISNFAKPGKQSIHNGSYWNDTPYLGFGAAAHSYDLLTRSWNVADINKYIESIEQGVLPSGHEDIDEDTHYDDTITTAMRTKIGLDLQKLKPYYREYALGCAEKDIRDGLLEVVDNHLRLTRRGLFVSDMVMSNLMKV